MSGRGPQIHLMTPAELARIERIDALLVSHESAVPELLAMLGDPSWAVRRAVVSALASRGDEAVRALCELLVGGRDDENRIAAVVDTLVASTGRHADIEVAKLGEHPVPAVVADVAQILGRRRASAAVVLLVRLTRHADDNVAVAAIEALGRIGGRAAIEALIDAVRSGNFFRSFPAVDVLGRTGDPRAVEPLVELLADSQLATEAARALGRTGERHALYPLARLLLARSEALVRVSAVAITELEQRHRARTGDAIAITAALRELAEPPMARNLAAALADADEKEQAAIARVLGVLGGADAVATLSRMLDAENVVAAAAAEALVTATEVAHDEITRSIINGDSARRLVMLPRMTSRTAVAAVTGCLSDLDPRVRVAACDALGRLGAATEVEAMFKLLGDSHPRVAQAAVAAIQAIGGPAVERLALAAAGDDDPGVRRAAIRILSYFGWSSALPVLLDAVRDSDPRVVDAAIQGLPFVQEPRALVELLAAARDENPRKRASAARALGRCRDEIRVVAALLRHLGDDDAWVRYYGCQSLGRLGVETATAAIARLLDDPAGQVRVAAIEALSHLRGELAFEALRRAMRSDDADMQRAALVGLGMSRRPEAEPLLLDATRSEDVSTRLVAIAALADFEGSDGVMKALAAGCDDPDEAVRNAAIGFLATRTGTDATRALIARLACAGDPERVIDALAQPVDGRAAVIAEALASADEECAPHLVAALSRMQRAEADALLRAACTSPHVPARKAAAHAVAAQRGPEARATLRRMATEDPDPDVRRIVALLTAP